MQTFLPYPSFSASAQCLDNRRLGKQRVEVLQILMALKQGPFKLDKKKGKLVPTPWYNHPAVRMWKGHEGALVCYGLAICYEWIGRGYKDSCRSKLKKLHPEDSFDLPRWLGNSEFHKSHQSNLLRKDPVFYGKYGWDVLPNLPYVWPV